MTSALLLALFDAEMARTAAVLAHVPDEALDWTPHPRSFTLGRLAMHVAMLPGWMAAFTGRDGYDMGVGGPGPPVPGRLAEIEDAFAQASTRGRAELAACDDARLAQPWTLSRDGATVEVLTRGSAIATFGLHHLVHHRGQLTIYLRLRDIAVPALYGDSADARFGPPATDPPAGIR